ncbi:MAG: hypothetical protein GF349_01570 [Candidatus Magasanikbacteria bacterium]|nr:hypothetical protein [Candidatus Magasanikbacteria bacterium]
MNVEIGIFSFNLGSLSDFFAQGIFQIIIQLLAIFGWLVLAALLLFVALFFYQEYRQEKYTKDWKWVVLAIDIPPLNLQTPKAVEQMFAQLAGAFDQPNIADKFYYGYKQKWFSFEIVSIEGYIQFLVRTEEAFRDLVEASIYAQYPDAEITEVEDYVNEIPDSYPNEEYDLWMADFGLEEEDSYPIRTFDDFMDKISKDDILKDPMSAFLESFSRIGPGEQMWFQILLEPISSSWKEQSIKKVKELIGDKSLGSTGGSKVAEFITSGSLKAIESIGDQVFGREAGASNGNEIDRDAPNQLQYLTPGQTKLVEAIENKISKIGFKVKLRGGYIARKEVFKAERGVNLMIGAINQYNIPSANSILPKYGVGASYFFKDQRKAYRKRLLIKAYKKRKIAVGANPFILNIEELATLWHFPMSQVKAPLLQKTQAKQTEPPIGLPVEGVPEPEKEEESEEEGYQIDTGDVGFKEDVEFG